MYPQNNNNDNKKFFKRNRPFMEETVKSVSETRVLDARPKLLGFYM
jgi:hypothetical protein